MNTLPIARIRAELRSMYPGYRFEMKAIPATYSYAVTVYKSQDNVSTLTVEAETPTNVFWERVIAWMRPILGVYGA